MKTNSPPCRWLSILISLYFYTTGSVTASNWQGASAAAQATVHNMDLTVNRCEKFYQYACGNWLNAHPASDTDTILVADQFGIADNRIQKLLLQTLEDPQLVQKTPATSIYRDLYSKMQTLYRTCMNEEQVNREGLEPMQRQIQELLDLHESKNASLINQLAFMHNNGLDGVLHLTLVAERVIDGIRVVDGIRIQKPYPNLRNNNKYLDGQSMANYTLAVSRIFQTILGEMNARIRERILKKGETWQDVARNVVAFETKLFARNDEESSFAFSDSSISELQEKFPLVNWTELLNLLYFKKQQSPTQEKIARQFPLRFYDRQYTTRLASILRDSQTSRSLVYWHIWMLIVKKAKDLPRKYRVVPGNLNDLLATPQLMIDETAESDHVDACMKFAQRTGMDSVLLKAYVDRRIMEGSLNVEKSLQLMADIRQAFHSRLGGLKWLEPADRVKAAFKESKMKVNFLMPDFLRNETSMRQRFAGLQVDNSSYYANSVNLDKFDAIYEARKLGNPQLIRDEVILAAQYFPARNAQYYRSNSILIPATILAPPFYDPQLPKSMQLGSIGHILAHELTHGFDPDGKNYDADGRRNPWLSPAAASEYQKLANCYVQQYNQLRVDNKTNLDGNRTVIENIADNGGLRLAWTAYKAQGTTAVGNIPVEFTKLKLNSDQLFFLAFAQSWCSKDPMGSDSVNQHSPHRLRVIGTLANMPEFHRAFQCKAPAKICEMW